MANQELWSKIHAERRAFAELVESLSEEQLATPSSCAGWSVRDVIAHMISTAHVSPATFFPGFIASGFNINRFFDKGIAKYSGGSGADLATKIRETATMTKSPPGPTITVLGEMIVHGEDVRRPLGLRTSYPADHLIQVGNFYKGSNVLLGSKKRIAGVTLRANDIDWSTGEGPEVIGPGADVISAMTGRKDALKDLSGPGFDLFAARF